VLLLLLLLLPPLRGQSRCRSFARKNTASIAQHSNWRVALNDVHRNSLKYTSPTESD
jgi:hypothetical protein